MNITSRMTEHSSRLLIVAVCAILLSGCGAAVQRESTGIQEATGVKLLAEDLTGATIVVDGSTMQVTAADLTAFRFGVLGAADRREEALDRVDLPMSPGSHDLEVRKDGRTLLRREVFISKGQVREVRL